MLVRISLELHFFLFHLPGNEYRTFYDSPPEVRTPGHTTRVLAMLPVLPSRSLGEKKIIGRIICHSSSQSPKFLV